MIASAATWTISRLTAAASMVPAPLGQSRMMIALQPLEARLLLGIEAHGQIGEVLVVAALQHGAVAVEPGDSAAVAMPQAIAGGAAIGGEAPVDLRQQRLDPLPGHGRDRDLIAVADPRLQLFALLDG